MPRELRPATTFDTLEDEVIFTRAALKADPDASDLLPMTEGWLERIDEARTGDRSVRQSAVEADASRGIANGRLDAACMRFGDELFLAVGKDRAHPRWLQFFKLAVSRFVRTALPSQVLTVRGWFASTDPVLASHRPDLERWATAADAALIADRSLAVARGENWQQRIELCDGLTRDRDGLFAALVERAGERGLDRAWPGLFFRVVQRGADRAERAEEESLPPEPGPLFNPV